MATIEDSRGQVVRRLGTSQTFLCHGEVGRLIDDYRSGANVASLSEKYGIHRSTVSTHLTRNGVARRPPGISVDEAAEILGLHQDGLSLRAISQIAGVGRKSVKRVVSVDFILCNPIPILPKRP